MSRYSEKQTRERERFFKSDLQEVYIYNKAHDFDSLLVSFAEYFNIGVKEIRGRKSIYSNFFIVLLNILPVKYNTEEIKIVLSTRLDNLSVLKTNLNIRFNKDEWFRKQIIYFSEQYLTQSTRIKLIRLLK